MAASGLRLNTALLTGSTLRAHVRPGLGAFHSADIKLIANAEREKVADSIDFDNACKTQFPHANRWDYLLSVPTASAIIGVERHSARDSEIGVVIAKKRFAVQYLRDHLPSQHRVSRWLWVTRGTVGFSRMERARRRLDQSGIEFAGRLLRSFV